MQNAADSTRPARPCKFLRSKEMYYQSWGQPEDDFSGGSYWCVKTQEPLGPDRALVGRSECCDARECYSR